MNAGSDRSEGEHAHGGSPRELGEAATLPAPWSSAAGPGLPAPSLGGVAEVAERDRVFEALFQVPAERQRLGRYLVLGTLGRGGMGTVLEAFDRTLDRCVAVKVLHGDLSEQHRHRLLREAQALAKLSHPNVVQVYEVGEADGQVFIAMELVRGKSLWEWVRREPRPGWRECVKVYLQAGKGLAAAHGEGLVHRDFKPGNAVIDEKGRVRVLDFGMARQGEDAEQSERKRTLSDVGVEENALESALTQTGTVLGTLAYMPLEQMEGRQADARSDQFSFCVALYEGLYGERPFAGGSMEALMLALHIGKVRPAPKGTVVPEALRKVVVRGLAIEPGERWPSMEALLAELRRLVSPRRRRYWALGVMAGLLVMGAGFWQYAEVGFRCEGAAAQLEGVWDEGRKREVKAAMLGTELVYAPGTWERVEQRLDDYAEAWAGKHTEVCEATRVTEEQTEEAMDLRMECLRERRTALRAAVKVLAGADAEVVEEAVGLVAGLPMLDRCDDVKLLEQQRQRVPPPEEPQVAQEVESLRERLADIEAEQEAGKYAQALHQVEPLVERAEALGYAPLLAEMKLRRGSLLGDSGKHAEAERELKAAYTLALEHEHDDVVLHSAQELTFAVGVRQARHAEGIIWGETALPLAERGGKDIDLATSLSNLGNVFDHQGEYEQAKLHLQRALQIEERVLGTDHPDVAGSLNNLGIVFKHQGEYEQAGLHYRRALQILEKTLGADHPHVAMSLNNLGHVFKHQGEYEQAKLHHQRALQIKERALGADHPDVAVNLSSLGNVYYEQGEYEQARLHYQRALQIWEKALGAAHPKVAMSLNNLGNVFYKQGENEQAKLHYQRALQLWEKALGADHPDVALSSSNLGEVFREQGEYEQAKLHLQRALQTREKALGVDHPDLVLSLISLGEVFREQGEYEQAKLHHQRALQIQEKALGADHPSVAGSLTKLGSLFYEQEEYERAKPHYQRALQIQEKALGADHPSTAGILTSLGFVFYEQGEYEQAKLHHQRALQVQEKALGANHPELAASLVGMARVAVAQEQFDLARDHAERALSIREADQVAPERLADARVLLARALWADRSQRARARELAEQARDAYAELGEPQRESLVEVEQWLVEHRAP